MIIHGSILGALNIIWEGGRGGLAEVKLAKVELAGSAPAREQSGRGWVGRPIGGAGFLRGQRHP